MRHAKTLVVGIGSPHGDDIVGWLAADLLRRDDEVHDVRIEKANSPIQVFDWIDDCERLILCDGCSGLGSLGQTRRWEWPTPEIEQVTWSGTHDFSLIATLQLADRLGRLPRQVILWSIEIAPGNFGNAMSPDVALALPTFVQRVKNEMVTDCIET